MNKLSPGQYGPYNFDGRRYDVTFEGGIDRCASVSLRGTGGATVPVQFPSSSSADAGEVSVGQLKGQYFVVIMFHQPVCTGAIGFRPSP